MIRLAFSYAMPSSLAGFPGAVVAIGDAPAARAGTGIANINAAIVTASDDVIRFPNAPFAGKHTPKPPLRCPV